MTQDHTEFDFQDAQSLMALANRPELQADEKPLFTTSKNRDSDLTIANNDGSAYAEELQDHKVVYNPHSGRIFDAVTDDYEIINPPEFIGPLVDRLEERNRTDVHGKLWVRNDGANAFGQLIFDTDEFAIWPHDRQGREHPVRAGFNFRWSHESSMSVKAEGFAQDGQCTNTIRGVTSSIYVKHSGDVDERVDWGHEWDTVLDQMGAFCNSLGAIIEEALDHTLFDLGAPEVPLDMWRDATEPLDTLEEATAVGPITDEQRDALYGFYELLDFPKYISVSATARLMFRAAQKDDPRVLTTWDVHSALTYALTHALRGIPGASDDDYHRKASEVLLNPEKAIQDVNEAARDELGPDERDQTVLAMGEELDDEDAGDAMRTYHERARELEESFGA